jgi:hypothetical protein
MNERFLYCPYCWQRISVLIERESEELEWIEDCEVCCNPILFYTRNGEGRIVEFRYERAQ